MKLLFLSFVLCSTKYQKNYPERDGKNVRTRTNNSMNCSIFFKWFCLKRVLFYTRGAWLILANVTNTSHVICSISISFFRPSKAENIKSLKMKKHRYRMLFILIQNITCPWFDILFCFSAQQKINNNNNKTGKIMRNLI